jgi:SulP family sulfate permease
MLGLEKKDLVPLQLAGWTPPHNVVFDFVTTLSNVGRTNIVALTAGLATLFLVRGVQWAEPRLKRRIPGPFVAVAVISITAWLLGLGEPSQGALKLKLVRDIEPVARKLPALVTPELRWDHIQALIGPALAIGLLGAVEAIAIGKVLATKVGHTFNASRQLVGEGLCNIGAAAIGGFASSGSFTRSAVNFDSGAVTRLSCIFSGILVLVIVLAFGPAANYIPIAVLAGTLIHIGLKLVNVAQMRMMIQATISDRIVLLTTFISVLFARHLEYALFLGIGVSLFQALRRAEGFKIALLQEDGQGNLIELPLMSTHQPGEVVALDLQGEMFFAAAEVLEHRLKRMIRHGNRFMVLRLTQAYNMDATTAEALAHVAKEARAHRGRLILAGVRPGMYGTLERAGLVQQMGPESIFQLEPLVLSSTLKALAYAHQLAGTPDATRAQDGGAAASSPA